tara:strand:- start:61 stop:564 length:504 start_codon:yes stop_codon:yes gene_type:complete
MGKEYYQLGWDDRNADQSNIAEDEAWNFFSTDESWRIARWGFNEKENYRNKITKGWWYCIPKVLAKSPDGVVIYNKNNKYYPYFLEIKAVGLKSLKLKKEDLKYMSIWRQTKGVKGLILYAWSCNLQKHFIAEYNDWVNLVNDVNPEVKKFFDNGKEYYDIPVDKLF